MRRRDAMLQTLHCLRRSRSGLAPCGRWLPSARLRPAVIVTSQAEIYKCCIGVVQPNCPLPARPSASVLRRRRGPTLVKEIVRSGDFWGFINCRGGWIGKTVVFCAPSLSAWWHHRIMDLSNVHLSLSSNMYRGDAKLTSLICRQTALRLPAVTNLISIFHLLCAAEVHRTTSGG